MEYFDVVTKTSGKEKKRRPLTAYKYFMKACIKELHNHFPNSTIVLPLVSKMCSKAWEEMDERMKHVFQIEANNVMEQNKLPAADDDYCNPSLSNSFGDGSNNNAAYEASEPTCEIPVAPAPKMKAKIINETCRKEAFAKKERKGVITTAQGLSVPSSSSTNHPKHYAKASKKNKKGMPGGPRRPLSAFVWFCKEERPRVQSENPGLAMGEISKILGKHWHHLTPEGKRKYQDISRGDSERYVEEMNIMKKAKAPTTENQVESVPNASAPVEVELPIGIPIQLIKIEKEPLDDAYEVEEFKDMSVEDLVKLTAACHENGTNISKVEQDFRKKNLTANGATRKQSHGDDLEFESLMLKCAENIVDW